MMSIFLRSSGVFDGVAALIIHHSLKIVKMNKIIIISSLLLLNLNLHDIDLIINFFNFKLKLKQFTIICIDFLILSFMNLRKIHERHEILSIIQRNNVEHFAVLGNKIWEFRVILRLIIVIIVNNTSIYMLLHHLHQVVGTVAGEELILFGHALSVKRRVDSLNSGSTSASAVEEEILQCCCISLFYGHLGAKSLQENYSLPVDFFGGVPNDHQIIPDDQIKPCVLILQEIQIVLTRQVIFSIRPKFSAFFRRKKKDSKVLYLLQKEAKGFKVKYTLLKAFGNSRMDDPLEIN
ncbi:hypothetical protein M5K25_026547 [Dendrobium thyrsiflorum]|uniref:Uncharacterized protein n=1 Tax=Dendrobium thyrsiflorum TaxID=117978 RepID=A0ABD0TXU3_DENTH